MSYQPFNFRSKPYIFHYQTELHHLQVRNVSFTKQIGDPSGLSDNIGPVQRPRAAPAWFVKQPELRLRTAAENRERRQRQARCDLRVYRVRESDSAVVPGRRTGTGARASNFTLSEMVTHRLNVNQRVTESVSREQLPWRFSVVESGYECK